MTLVESLLLSGPPFPHLGHKTVGPDQRHQYGNTQEWMETIDTSYVTNIEGFGFLFLCVVGGRGV